MHLGHQVKTIEQPMKPVQHSVPWRLEPCPPWLSIETKTPLKRSMASFWCHWMMNSIFSMYGGAMLQKVPRVNQTARGRCFGSNAAATSWALS